MIATYLTCRHEESISFSFLVNVKLFLQHTHSAPEAAEAGGGKVPCSGAAE